VNTTTVIPIDPQAPRLTNTDANAGDPPVAVRSMTAIGTMASVAVTDPRRANEALGALANELRALDQACSRFRPDSELRRVEARGQTRPVQISPLLFEVIDTACRVAVETAGTVDPTVGSALVALGYDRDFSQINASDRPETADSFVARPAPGWWQITLDPEAGTVSIPAGVHVDLGATAKAFASDRAAARLSAALDCGVLVNLGGDVAVAGAAPDGGWAVGIAAHCATETDHVDQVVTILNGGLATSGTTARTWWRAGRRVHHIVDPWTGEAAPAVWSLVSAAASSCVEANAWSTAAVVWGKMAVDNLRSWDVTARLVDAHGSVTTVGRWPADQATAEAHAERPTGPVQ
jgi:thiamine biosynthesis lipoprotein